jgi:subtilisin family serine protease
VIGVTALDAADRIYSDAAQGAHVDFAAPGVDVFVPVGERGRYESGTSVAAPHITALIASTNFLETNSHAIVSDLSSSARDLGEPGRDTTFGFGAPRFRSGCGNFKQ